MAIFRLDDHRDQAGAHEIIEAARGRIAFDIGANLGVTARVLAANFHTVIALEPCLESFTILLEESAPNVVPIMAAASATRGSVELTVSEQSIKSGQLTTGSALGWGAAMGTRSVDSVTVDDLIAHYGQPDFTKIDTEAHECFVLEGWSEPRHGDVLIEVHRAENEGIVRNMWGKPLRKLTHDVSVPARFRDNHCWLTTVGA